MPWLWRPFLGPVWIEGNRFREGKKTPETDTVEKSMAPGEGDDFVNSNTGSCCGCAAKECSPGDISCQGSKKPAGLEQATKPTICGSWASEQITGSGGKNAASPDDCRSKAGQVSREHFYLSLDEKFAEVAPGVYRFKRGGDMQPAFTPTWKPGPGTGSGRQARVDTAWYQPVSSSIINHYHMVGKTRDGIPIYCFK